MTDWTPEPRPVPAELINVHNHADYAPPIVWDSIANRIDAITAADLRLMARNVL